MRIDEFIHSPKNTPESNLTTALELIQHRYKDQETVPKISTNSLINLVRNTDRTFDYEALAQANETNPAVKNLILPAPLLVPTDTRYAWSPLAIKSK